MAQDLVTRASALAAIDHVSASNTGNRDQEAIHMLKPAHCLSPAELVNAANIHASDGPGVVVQKLANVARDEIDSFDAPHARASRPPLGYGVTAPAGYVRADQAYDVQTLFADLQDVCAEAGAVGTVIGRHEMLMQKLFSIRDAVGQALNGYLPISAPPAEPMSALGEARPLPMCDAPKDGTVIQVFAQGTDFPHPMRWAEPMRNESHAETDTLEACWRLTWDDTQFQEFELLGWLPIPLYLGDTVLAASRAPTGPTDAVPVCPECDIAGCHHLRAPTPPLTGLFFNHAEIRLPKTGNAVDSPGLPGSWRVASLYSDVLLDARQYAATGRAMAASGEMLLILQKVAAKLGSRPYGTGSYLPKEIRDGVHAAIAKATKGSATIAPAQRGS